MKGAVFVNSLATFAAVATIEKMDSSPEQELTSEELAWVLRDNELRDRARAFAAKHERDEESIYRTMKNLRRTPAERLRIGLMHGRLRPDPR